MPVSTSPEPSTAAQKTFGPGAQETSTRLPAGPITWGAVQRPELSDISLPSPSTATHVPSVGHDTDSGLAAAWSIATGADHCPPERREGRGAAAGGERAGQGR